MFGKNRADPTHFCEVIMPRVGGILENVHHAFDGIVVRDADAPAVQK